MDESEVLKFEQPAKVLKLSEAIRIGSKMSPANDGATFFGGGTCAVGAAYEAIFGTKKVPYPNTPCDMVREYFGMQNAQWHGELQISLRYSEMGEGRSREAIADWLEERGY